MLSETGTRQNMGPFQHKQTVDGRVLLCNYAQLKLRRQWGSQVRPPLQPRLGCGKSQPPFRGDAKTERRGRSVQPEGSAARLHGNTLQGGWKIDKWQLYQGNVAMFHNSCRPVKTKIKRCNVDEAWFNTPFLVARHLVKTDLFQQTVLQTGYNKNIHHLSFWRCLWSEATFWPCIRVTQPSLTSWSDRVLSSLLRSCFRADCYMWAWRARLFPSSITTIRAWRVCALKPIEVSLIAGVLNYLKNRHSWVWNKMRPTLEQHNDLQVVV